MRYRTFGNTGLRVSEYALGTANFGTKWPTGADKDTSRAIFERFADAGGIFFDTADVYQFGEAETFLGEFLSGQRDDFVLATKFSQGANPKPGISTTGNGRKNIRRSVEASLRRLNTDYIDLLWAHWPDAVTPVEEIVATFEDLIRAGKILHGGLSNFPAWRIARASTLSELNRSSALVGAQFEYSLVARDAERELLPAVEALGLGTVTYSPLGG
ncbi:MAG: Oxidoreductase, aldo/keto reductase family, partial [Pseudonocardiales bacterium]|nr:Oxidoreductase, aldo/keto reductase family [Pseudonocardiales bacterium]